MLSDPISDMLTRIRNACMIQHRQVAMPSSRVKAGLAQILKEEGFIQDFAVLPETPQSRLVLNLKYTGKGDPVITGLERVSKPGRRIYTGYKSIPWVRSGLGVNILSTPSGLMTGRQARKERVGGEVICNVW